MKASGLASQFGICIAGLIFIAQAASASGKAIRFRDETIFPKAPPLVQSQKTGAASGLFLIQFTGPVQPLWRQQLTGLCVDLLAYVPEDAFVSRFRDANPDQVRQLGFVSSVQEFQPRHKLHPALQRQVAKSRPATQSPGGSENVAPVEISVLLAPGATASEAEDVRRRFLSVPKESRHRFGGILRGKIAPARLEALARCGAVLWIEPLARMKLNDEVASKIVAGNGGAHQTLTQSLGYDGSGVTVAVADSGLQNGDAPTMHPDLFGRVTSFFYYGSLTNAADENGHGTHVAGIIAGDGATGEIDGGGNLYGLGVAPGASIIAQRVFDGDGNLVVFDDATLARDATQAGAVIGSNSWGDKNANGQYDLSSAEFDELVRDADFTTSGDQPYILGFSAGNDGPGPQTIESPATAKNVIATGASENDRTNFFSYPDGPEVMAGFSSRGPASDGRIKPDLVAPGTWIASLQSASAPASNALLSISTNYAYCEGTSQAGAHVSGAAAVFVQYYRATHTNATPSPALVKAALINSVMDMDDSFDTGPVPNMDEGWGRVNVAALIQPDRQFLFVDQTDLLTTGQICEQPCFVTGSGKPLKITLVYTDFPGVPFAAQSLVNDLDLVVIAPDGTTYRGNQFDANGESVPDATQADRINNVEGVFIAAPVPGEYQVQVQAHNVVADSRVETLAVDQDFALVLSGMILSPGAGGILLDRQFYTAPDQIKVKVIDPHLAGSNSVNVVFKSATETNGLAKVLYASGGSGVFTGTIATVTGPAAPDANLQIANGDTIQAGYYDSFTGTNRYAFATADLIPPGLSAVGVTNAFGFMVVSWQSTEPATSIVRFGTNAANLNFAVTNLALAQAHSVSLDGLPPGQNYYFEVISADEAGNFTTNNNAGTLYVFAVAPTDPVLLVDAYVPDATSVNIPLSTYTGALDQIGVGYDVWSVLQNNSVPNLAQLSHYRAVIWRVNDSYTSTSPYSTLSCSDQSLIRDYIDAGGAFFMSSMEILSRIGDVPFRSHVLQVAQFISNSVPYMYCPVCDQDVGIPELQGMTGDPIFAGVDLALDFSDYPTGRFFGPDQLRQDLSDTLTPRTNAVGIFQDAGSGRICGVRFSGDAQTGNGRVVFLSFPLDALPEAGSAPNNRAAVLRNILDFLIPNIQVTNNLWQAHFTLTGPTNYSGSGINALIANAPPGQYVVTFGGVPYYQTPAPQTNTLVVGSNLVFYGNYDFPDVNTNGISDLWEQACFGSVSSNHPAWFDADGDGLNDYAEFFAGTNPTNSMSSLRLTATMIASNSTIRLDWPTVLNRAYQVEGCNNLDDPWTPRSSWMQATTNTRSCTLPVVNGSQFFRVQVRP